MSKIICDICGTVYPDNATVCPICGYPRQDNDKTVQTTAAAAAGTQVVKGGRFSNKNVKKRNSAAGEPARRSGTQRPARQDSAYSQEEKNPNKGLRGVAIVLLIAVILVITKKKKPEAANQ